MTPQLIGWLMMAPLLVVVVIGIVSDFRNFVLTATFVGLAFLAAYGAKLVWP